MNKLKHGVDMAETAFSWLRSLPRLSLNNLREEPGLYPKKKRGRGRYGGKRHGTKQKGCEQRQNFMRTGYETGSTPFYLRFTKEHYYAGHHLKKQYPPMSLLTLQKLIDTDRLDCTTGLIDLASLCNTGLYNFNPLDLECGVQLTDEGINKFSAKIDIEVQYASEQVIAAIERLGGSITLAYYDNQSLFALRNPKKFFLSGKPIPKRLLPTEDVIAIYTDPKKRGYLADPQAVEYERGVLAQKYGYELVKRDPPIRKDPMQVFLGLQPGWIVNLIDKVILKPTDPELIKYYNSLAAYNYETDKIEQKNK